MSGHNSRGTSIERTRLVLLLKTEQGNSRGGREAGRETEFKGEMEAWTDRGSGEKQRCPETKIRRETDSQRETSRTQSDGETAAVRETDIDGEGGPGRMC